MKRPCQICLKLTNLKMTSMLRTTQNYILNWTMQPFILASSCFPIYLFFCFPFRSVKQNKSFFIFFLSTSNFPTQQYVGVWNFREAQISAELRQTHQTSKKEHTISTSYTGIIIIIISLSLSLSLYVLIIGTIINSVHSGRQLKKKENSTPLHTPILSGHTETYNILYVQWSK